MLPIFLTNDIRKFWCIFAAGLFAMLLLGERVEAGVLVPGSSQSCVTSNSNLTGGMSAEQLHKLLLTATRRRDRACCRRSWSVGLFATKHLLDDDCFDRSTSSSGCPSPRFARAGPSLWLPTSISRILFSVASFDLQSTLSVDVVLLHSFCLESLT